ncbi:MAG: heparan-alpha-glucosaminide N-acetyltransferase [Candidatus Methanoperedens sp.]|nr:heparan-alpha-glucosaminide N-acetyltransferase [Candidatus Methanoperedens sp.]
MNVDKSLFEQERITSIDMIKGIDIVFMVLFNYSITLDYFKLIRIPSHYLYQYILPISIASIFIFMSGVTTYLNYIKYKEKLTKKYFSRGTKLLFFAALITLFSYIFVPQYTIYFGILHFFAASSFLVPLFIKAIKLNQITGIIIIFSGIYLQQRTFDFSYLFWLGFVPENLSTFDYFPLIPWFGVVLLGVHYGRFVIEKSANIKIKKRKFHIFTYLGKHSLTVYLVHQPALILLLFALGFKLF